MQDHMDGLTRGFYDIISKLQKQLDDSKFHLDKCQQVIDKKDKNEIKHNTYENIKKRKQYITKMLRKMIFG